MSLKRRVGAAVACAGMALATTGLVGGPTEGAQAAEAKAPGVATRLLVLNANVAEVLHVADVRNTKELANLARRAKAQLPAIPDVVTLQEASPWAAKVVAQELGKVYPGYTFQRRAGATVAKGGTQLSESNRPKRGAGLRGTQQKHDGYFSTAVLVNTRTVTFNKTLPSESFTLPAKDRASSKAFTNQSAGVLVTKRVSGVAKKYAVHSVHLPPGMQVKDGTLSGRKRFDALQLAWAKKLVATGRATPAATPVLAGDFNRQPCRDAQWRSLECTTPAGTASRPTASLWTTLRAAGYGATFPVTQKSIDNVFSPKAVSGGKDLDYLTFGAAPRFASDTAYAACSKQWMTNKVSTSTSTAAKVCRQRFYSDHAFTWGIVS